MQVMTRSYTRASEKPVYLLISDGHTETGTHLLCKTTWETDRLIKQSLGMLGPGGMHGTNGRELRFAGS